MKTLKAEEGKSLDLKPCVNFLPDQCLKPVCPCQNFSGEMLSQKGEITLFNCEHRKMHQAPKIKVKPSKRTLTGQSK